MAPRKGWSYFILPALIVSLASANTVVAFTRTYNELLFAPKIQVSYFNHLISHNNFKNIPNILKIVFDDIFLV